MIELSTEAWATVSTIGLALIGYLATYAQQRIQANRDAKLARVNAQLRELYGPLYSVLKANQSIWEQFSQKLWPSHGKAAYFAKGESLTEQELERWRVWMLEVFEPLNQKIEQVILDNGDLVEEENFRPIFVQTLSHIAAYRALYPRWQAGDFSEHTSVVDYPSDLLAHVEPIYLRLRARQAALMR